MKVPMRLAVIVVIGVVAVTVAADARAASADYLEPALRERVETLKRDVAVQPTNSTNAAQRVATLWAWANAYAVNGGYLPVNLTAMVRPGVVEAAVAAAATDAFVRELAMLDEDPAALGTLSSDAGPFEARAFATFEQRYRVGSQSITRGGGIVVARHFMADHGTFQTTDASADNFVSIRCSNTSVRFVADTTSVSGMHGGFRGAAQALMFRVDRGQLNAGDLVTVTYGDRSGGGRGLLMPTFSSDRMPFPLYVMLDASGHQYSLPIQAVQVTGAAVAGVHGFAPSVVRPGEKFEVSVRAEDAFYNRARTPIPAWRVTVNGAPLQDLAAGDGAISLIPDVHFDEPGVYRIAITSADGAITGVANPIVVSADAPRVYWGDTHGHSGFAEGIGTPDRFMTWARDDARLDFVTHSEHDIWMDDFEWQVLKNNVENYSQDGRFVAFLGYEWTTQNLYGGHHNVLFRTPQGRERIATQFYPTLSRLYAGLRAKHDAKDVVVIPHAHQAGDYRMSDPELEPLVEIMSQHGTFEWFGRMYLGHGHQVGFTAASDNHLSQPGYTAPKGQGLSQRGGLGGVLAQARTRDSIFEAMKSLRAYATTGERIVLDVTLNDAVMGQRAPFKRARLMRGRVVGTAPIESITVMKNDRQVWNRDYVTPESDVLADEETFYLSFSSASVPVHPGDNPRGWRPWGGHVEVIGATLASASLTDLTNPDVQHVRIDTANPNRVAFATLTRGDDSSLRLTLRGATADTVVKVNLEPGREFGGAPPVYRQQARVPAAAVELALAELKHGRVQRELSLDAYTDTVSLRRRIANGAMDAQFEFEDEGDVQGDYYYVRVKQVDDALAWSSPIWVGGFPSR